MNLGSSQSTSTFSIKFLRLDFLSLKTSVSSMFLSPSDYEAARFSSQLISS